MNDADKRAQLIDNKLNLAEWTRTITTRENLYRPGWAYTAGQSVFQDDGHQKLQPQKANYLLRCGETLLFAIVEAKDEGHAIGGGLQQTLDYAEKLWLLFANSFNGYVFKVWDFNFNTQRSLKIDEFPSPKELWNNRILDTNRPKNSHLRSYWREPDVDSKWIAIKKYYQRLMKIINNSDC